MLKYFVIMIWLLVLSAFTTPVLASQCHDAVIQSQSDEQIMASFVMDLATNLEIRGQDPTEANNPHNKVNGVALRPDGDGNLHQWFMG